MYVKLCQFYDKQKDMHKAYPNIYYKLFNSSVIARIASSTLEASLPPAQICSGNGGGKPDMAQAGGKDASKVDEAIRAITEELKS